MSHSRGIATGRCCLHVLCVLILVSLLFPHHPCSHGTGIVQHVAVVAAAAAAPAAALSTPLTETELIAVDLGHENMKVSAWRVQEEDVLTKAGGVGTVTTTTAAVSGAMSMVLNDQTNRKSPPCIAFRYFRAPAGVGDGNQTNMEEEEEGDGGLLYPPGYLLERTYAEQAQALAPRFPTQVVCSPAQLLGYTLRSSNSNSNSTIATVATESSPYQITGEQLTTAYSFHVKSIDQQRRQQCGGKGVRTDARPALGVFVPFFSTSTTDAAGDGSFFSAEELTAMLLGYARLMAEKADAVDNALSDDEERHLLQLLNSSGLADTVTTASSLRGHAVPRYAALTVPIHATVAQRQALVDAAALAGLRVVRLVHSTTGAAVQLAFLKAEQVFQVNKVQVIMIYDMGSQQAEVAIYRFSAVPANAAKRVKYDGAVELKALVGSRTLGGAAFDECIAAQWDALYFNQTILAGVGQAATELERRAAAKLRGSLLRAAHKAKETLSVNQEAHITLDGVHADPVLFSTTAQTQQRQRAVSVTADGVLTLRYARAEFERECRGLFDAAVALRDDAIAATNGLVSDVGALDRFEVIGGGTRIPLLLQRLSEGYRKDGKGLVDRTLNSDEAAVLGTTLLSVSAAPQALGLRGVRQTLPQYQVREWLTNAVYLSISGNDVHDDELPRSTAAASTQLRLLFPAQRTTLPATRSVRIELSTDADEPPAAAPNNTMAVVGDGGVRVTLYSGPEADVAYETHASAALAGSPHRHTPADLTDVVVEVPATSAACTGCCVRPYTVDGIAKAKEALQAQVRQRHPGGVVVLESAALVVEAVATVSGIPHCSVAYLRAVFRVTPALATTTTVEQTEGPRRVGAEELHEQTATTTAAAEVVIENDDAAVDEEDTNNNNSNEDQKAATDQPTATDVVEVKVAALSLRPAAAAAVVDRGYNMHRAELLRSHSRVRRLQAMDDARLRRSTLRNDIHSIIVWVKDQPEWDGVEGEAVVTTEAAPPITSPEQAASWRDVVRGVGDWLDDFGETAGVAELQERLAVMRAIKLALRAKQE
jgi:molecular chaperone DnaK (HSP70)